MKVLDPGIYQILLFIGAGLTGLSLLNLLIYFLRLQASGDRTTKYRFASGHEVQALKRSTNLIAFALVFTSYALITSAIGLTSEYTFYFVGFFAVLIGFAIGYGLYAYLEYYYPFQLEKKLNKIRFKPMKSPDGKEMRLLNEEEEDEFLTEDMKEEENALTADYDVWMEEGSGHKVIERYETTYHALVCEKCNFRTMKEKSEEIVEYPTVDEKGKMLKSYECSYCGNALTKEAKIPSLSEERQTQ